MVDGDDVDGAQRGGLGSDLEPPRGVDRDRLVAQHEVPTRRGDGDVERRAQPGSRARDPCGLLDPGVPVGEVLEIQQVLERAVPAATGTGQWFGIQA